MSALEAPREVRLEDMLGGMFQVGDIFDVGMIAIDPQMKIVQVNPWIVGASGGNAEDFIGRTIAEAFPEIAGTTKEEAFVRALAGEALLLAHRFHEYLIPLPCPPGVDCYERMQQTARVVPLRNKDDIVGAIAAVWDVTERAAREDELRVAKDAAETASRAKSDFLAAMSHELRTPLTAVIGYAELLSQEIGGALSEAHKQHADRISASAWHLIGIIDEVLTFSRAEAGHEEISFEMLDICDAMRSAMTLVEPQADAKHLTLTLKCESEPMMFESDPLRIQQILVNLLGNAVKFTESGGVTIRARMDGPELVVSVSDTGPGIPATHRQQIFEAFTQVDQTATRAKGGTGLGLPVSRKLAELLGGSLILEPQRDAGSTFTMRLPPRRNDPTTVAEDATAIERADGNGPTATPTSPSHGSARVTASAT